MKTRLIYNHALLAAVERYRNALWSVSGPEAAHLCRQLDEEFKEILNLIQPLKKQPKMKDKTNGKK